MLIINCVVSLLELKENNLKGAQLEVESLISKDQVLAADMEIF